MEVVLVNGPINVVRLEGNLYGIKKILYIFMDYHADVEYQTQCQNFDSIDITQYMINMFKQSDKDINIDLFFETTSTEIMSKQYPFRGRYIDELNKYFRYGYKERPFENIRFHYIDIRDFIKTDINLLLQNIQSSTKNIWSYYLSSTDYENLITSYELLFNNIYLIYNLLFPNKQHRYKPEVKIPAVYSKSDQEFNIEIIKKFINKILKKYNHKDVFNKFKELLDLAESRFIKIFKLIQNILEVLSKYGEYITKPINILSKQDSGDLIFYNYGKDIFKILECNAQLTIISNRIEVLSTKTFNIIIDLFFLRRFLDKDYVTNGVVYTGAAHSMNYIFMLIKYFDFTITNTSYFNPDYKNLNDITNFIKQTDMGSNIEQIFMPNSLYQCVNMTDFPKGFQ